jgi:hypothetical protein
MTLYTKNGEYPKQLPHMIRLSDGTVRSDRSTFTSQEIADAGYVEVENPPTVDYPNKLDWDGENLQWVVRPPSDRELMERWDEIRRECERLLDKSDYKVVKALEAKVDPDPAYVAYRQELRDLYNNVNNVDPWNVVWPTVETEPVPYNPSDTV